MVDRYKKIFFALMIGIVFSIAVMELLARLLPVSDAFLTEPVDDKNPFLHLKPNRNVFVSKGPLFENIVGNKWVNNYGYFSDIDYEKNIDQKKLVLLGSSLVTAHEVLNKNTIQSNLSKELDSRHKIYSIAASGAPQSQYLAYIPYVKEEFNVSAICIVIGIYDFNHSKYLGNMGSGYFFFDEKNNFELILDSKKVGIIQSIAINSALLRYLFLNMEIKRINFLSRKENSSVEDFSQLAKSKILADQFFKKLNTELNGIPTLIVLDSTNNNRYGLENSLESEQSFDGIMRAYLIKKAKESNIEVLNLGPIFYEDFKKNKQRFDFINDNHWNTHGHFIAAENIKKTMTFQNFIKN